MKKINCRVCGKEVIVNDDDVSKIKCSLCCQKSANDFQNAELEMSNSEIKEFEKEKKKVKNEYNSK